MLLATLLSLSALAQSPGTLIVEVQPDLRDCASPYCGGWFVHPVNRDTMPCIDGVARKWCYVADIDFGGLGLPADQQALVVQAASERRALLQVSARAFEFNGERFARLDASRAWVEPR